jgi:hypothetical protein
VSSVTFSERKDSKRHCLIGVQIHKTANNINDTK